MKRNTNIKLAAPLDRFTIEAIIGTGTFADVAVAVDRNRQGTSVAVKLLFDKKDKMYVFHAAQEIAILKMLKHPNIIELMEYCFKKRCMAFTMPYMHRGTLKQHVKRYGPMVGEELKLQQIMQQLCDALAYMHQINLMHGDIKCSNILIESYSVVDDVCTIKISLCDFGLSIVVMEELDEDHLTGTLNYMAPEKVLKQKFNHLSDLYSAGVVMYECLFGQVPFSGNMAFHTEIFTNTILAEIPEVATEDCLSLLKNLLSYNKHARLTGAKLLCHPFIMVPLKVFEGDNYNYAKVLIRHSQELERSGDFSGSYMCYREAIIHLEVYHVTTDDPRHRAYVRSRIQSYTVWSRRLRVAIANERAAVDVNLLPRDDLDFNRLTALCASTIELADGLNLAYTGQVYWREGFPQCAESYLTLGVGKLLAALENEPPGERRNMLGAKLNVWLDMIQSIKSHIKHNAEEQIRFSPNKSPESKRNYSAAMCSVLEKMQSSFAIVVNICPAMLKFWR